MNELGRLADIFDRRTRITLLLAAVGSMLVGVLDSLAVALVLPLVDLAASPATAATGTGLTARVASVLGTADPDRLVLLLTLAIIGLFVVKDLGQLVFSWWLSGFVFTQRVRTSAVILRHFLLAPYDEVSRRGVAELMRAMDANVMQVFNYAVGGVMTAIANGLAAAAVLVGLALVAPGPTAAAVVVFGLAAVAYLALVRPRATAAGQTMTEAALAGWRINLATLGGMKEIKLRGSHEHFLARFLDAALLGARAGRTATFLSTLPKYLFEVLFIGSVGVIVLWGDRLGPARDGGALGLVALFVAAGFRILPSVTGLLASVANIRVGAPAVALVREEVLAARAADPGRVASTTGYAGQEPLPFTRDLAAEGVHFGFPGRTPDVLRGVDLRLPVGGSMAIVGASGAGKSTLVDILIGLRHPTRGRVAVDGVDLAGHEAAWGRRIGYVPQEVFLLDGTLADNITFDQPSGRADAGRLARAVTLAQLDDLVAELPDGLGTEVGERGARLSGGQRQRVGLARALYLEPDVLVLDEATSALDNATEARIAAALVGLRGKVTLVVVAHRLSSIRHVDTIVHLVDGVIASAGRFEQLARTDPTFAHLVALGSLESPEPTPGGPGGPGGPGEPT